MAELKPDTITITIDTKKLEEFAVIIRETTERIDAALGDMLTNLKELRDG